MKNLLTSKSLAKIEILKNIPSPAYDFSSLNFFDKFKQFYETDYEINDINAPDFKNKIYTMAADLAGFPSCTMDICQEIKKMTRQEAVSIKTTFGTVNVFFISADELRVKTHICNIIYIISELLATKKFSLDVYCLLDDYERDIHVDNLHNYQHKIKELNQMSKGLNASGFTSYSDFIFVSHKEEINKLLIHELVHFFRCDGPVRSYDVDPKWGNTIPCKFYEAYTETLAIILHATYVMTVTGDNKFNYFIGREIIYSRYIVMKILKLYGYNKKNYRSFFTGPGKKHEQPIYLWEYLFIRLHILENFDKYHTFIDEKLTVNKDIIPHAKNLLTKWIPDLEIYFDISDEPIKNNYSYAIFDIM